MPCQRHTTMGVSQISHSAIQQTSSSWNQCVILAASHRSQASVFSPVGMAANLAIDTLPPMDDRSAGSGYLALPDPGEGPGVLLLHGWWGLTPFFRQVADRLAEAGFVVVAPDLFGGETAADPDHAARLLADADPNRLAHLVRSGLHHLRALSITGTGPCGVVGFGMGASMALWLSAREAEGVAATVVFYGTQDIDLRDAGCAYLGHYAERDDYISDDDLALFESSLHLDGHEPAVHRYPGTRQWFFEDDRDEHDPEAADLAWARTIAFLDRNVPPL